MTNIEPQEITEREEVLLRSMFPQGKDLTIKEIMKKTLYTSYERNNTYLRSLAQKKAIEKRKVGKTLVYSLMPRSWASKKAFHAYALEKAKKFSDKHKLISRALGELPQEETEVIIVFGSYAKNTQRKDSDIDVLIVSSEKGKTENILASLKRRYGLHIHAIVISKSEFVNIKKENKELWDSLVMQGILFKGYELFYYHAYET